MLRSFWNCGKPSGKATGRLSVHVNHNIFGARCGRGRVRQSQTRRGMDCGAPFEDHPRLTRITRLSTPHPWDSLVAAACSYFCFGGPFVLLLILLVPCLLFLPIVFLGWVALEAAWFVHRARLRAAHEPWTNPAAFPDRRRHLLRFLRLKEDCIPCFNAFLGEWFRGADPRLIRRENAREFFRYGFYGGVDGPLSAEEEEEIDWWMGEVEKTWGIRFEPGRTEGLTFMAHMREPLKVMHQPLFVVGYSHAAETLAGLVLRCWGFKHHTCRDTGVTYWLRGGHARGRAGMGDEDEERQRAARATCRACSGGGENDANPRRCFAGCEPRPADDAAPVVVLHGLGVGLPPYLWMAAHLLRARSDRPVAMVCLPEVSLRAVTRVLTPDEMVHAVEGLCVKHGLRQPCLLGHSFGTFLVARACQRSVVAATVVIDPVATCLMLPTVISRVLYQLEDSFRVLMGREPAGMAMLSKEARNWVRSEGSSAAAEEKTRAARDGDGRAREGRPSVFRGGWQKWSWRFGNVALTLFRDLFTVRELSCNVALCRQFWWYSVCMWPEDMPIKSLVVIESFDAILDPHAIAKHVLQRDAGEVLWLEGFAHGEVLAPQGYEARRRLVAFIGGLDGD